MSVTVLPLMIVQYWTHSVETPIIVDPQWIYSIDDPGEFSCLLRWGWAFVYFWITYVRFIPIMLTVCHAPPPSTNIEFFVIHVTSIIWMTSRHHLLNQCWIIIGNVPYIFMKAISLWPSSALCNEFEGHVCKITATSPRSQWVYIWMPVQNGR